MRRATVVIGANYGDEGKGLVVDYLASKIPSDRKVVVRFNGGAQAGHTVNAYGKRHVFSHFGAGSFTGASTYLAKHFVCNPLLFWKEHRQLQDLGVTPQVAVDPRCFVTTPYDMIINQLVEDNRSLNRHGSCGVGFGETIERSLYPSLRFHSADLADRKGLIARLKLIRDVWMPERCIQLKCLPLKKDDPRLSNQLLEKFADAAQGFSVATMVAGAEFMDGKDIIFEGAQGLALDMDGPNFPHVTRSNTGLTNVLPLANALNLQLEVVYVTRTYITKHGAGPLPKEYKPDPPIVDLTNTDHPYQGTIRFAPLDVESMKARVAADIKLSHKSEYGFIVTCADQVPISPDLAKLARFVTTSAIREDIQQS